MSVITYGELLYGTEKSQQATKVMNALNELCGYIPPLPLSLNVAQHYGKTHANLEKKGIITGTNGYFLLRWFLYDIFVQIILIEIF